MKNSDGPAKPTNALDLEFPDWSGMDRFTPRLSPKAALLWNEKFREPGTARADANFRLLKCEVEFVL
jgi:hypothetical protein